MGIIADKTGERYGRLVVIKQGPDKISPRGKRIITWICKCDCGNVTTVRSGHLTSHHTISCGCAHREQQEWWKTFAITHGRTKEKSYKTWCFIKQRCYNKKDVDYPYYGGRGVRISDEWINNPELFCEYVESLPRYSEDGTTIDRINPNRNYERGNLRWLSLGEQQSNKRNNVFLTFDGRTMTMTEWAKETGIAQTTLSRRKKAGWSVEQMLTIRPHPHNRPRGNIGGENDRVCKGR